MSRASQGVIFAISLLAISSFASADWNPRPGWKDSYAVDGRCYCDSSNYDHNLSSKSADTPLGRKNVVQICNDIRNQLGTGPTQGRIPFNDIQCGHGPANDAADEAGCPGRVDIGTAGCHIKGPRWDLEAVYGNGDHSPDELVTSAPPPAPGGAATAEPPATISQPPPPPGAIGKVGANDLVALHYDNCPDRNDGHALAAGKAVVVRTGLSNVMVVNGTCGDRIRSAYQQSSEALIRTVWDNQWLDYYNLADSAIQTAAQRWTGVLANGGHVWVAEGGPSDFTARVLQRIRSQVPSINLKKVHVVQHSSGSNFNEAQTSHSNIELVKRLADYRAIPNGSGAGNGTANLRNKSSFFIHTARQSEFSNEWNAAFNYLNPNERLDFSDTVGLLYLINDSTTQTVDDFAQRYLR